MEDNKDIEKNIDIEKIIKERLERESKKHDEELKKRDEKLQELEDIIKNKTAVISSVKEKTGASENDDVVAKLDNLIKEREEEKRNNEKELKKSNFRTRLLQNNVESELIETLVNSVSIEAMDDFNINSLPKSTLKGLNVDKETKDSAISTNLVYENAKKQLNKRR